AVMRRMSSFKPKISWITMTPAGGRRRCRARAPPASAARSRRERRRPGWRPGSRPPEGDRVVAEPVDARLLAGVDDDGRERLVDERRAVDRRPGAELRAVVDRGRNDTAAEERLARSRPRLRRRRALGPRERRFLLGGDRLHAQPAQDRLLVAARVGVERLVHAVEAL